MTMIMIVHTFVVVALAYALLISAAVPYKRDGVQGLNTAEAKLLNAEYASLTPNSPCTSGQNACVNGEFAQCVNGKYVLTACSGVAIKGFSRMGENTIEAKLLNAQYASLTPDSSCTSGQIACVDGEFAKCGSGKYVLIPCPA
ncbi:hypothetical protein OG21DRAFT_1520788 [Imleria badia]|nr:hypothetical protein OG21DRAFT_1520788 [Imleria badia]